MVETVTQQIDDPEAFGEFLTTRGSLEYLQALHQKIDQTLADAEANPQGFAMNRRLSGIEQMLQELRGGVAPAGSDDSRQAATDQDAETASTLGPSKIPDDLAFIRGEGYPSQLAILAKREALALLDAATAVGVKLDYQTVVDRWVQEGRTRPIKDVAKGLIAGSSRDSHKRSLGKKPPTRRHPKGRPTGGKKKPSGSSPKAVAWDDIPKILVKELQGQTAASELKS